MKYGGRVANEEVVPVVVSHGDWVARRAVAFAMDDAVSIVAAADRLVALAAGDRLVLLRARDRLEALSRIAKATTGPVMERAAESVDLALTQHARADQAASLGDERKRDFPASWSGETDER